MVTCNNGFIAITLELFDKGVDTVQMINNLNFVASIKG